MGFAAVALRASPMPFNFDMSVQSSAFSARGPKRPSRLTPHYQCGPPLG